MRTRDYSSDNYQNALLIRDVGKHSDDGSVGKGGAKLGVGRNGCPE